MLKKNPARDQSTRLRPFLAASREQARATATVMRKARTERDELAPVAARIIGCPTGVGSASLA